jgi:hypothetical protein
MLKQTILASSSPVPEFQSGLTATVTLPNPIGEPQSLVLPSTSSCQILDVMEQKPTHSLPGGHSLSRLSFFFSSGASPVPHSSLLYSTLLPGCTRLLCLFTFCAIWFLVVPNEVHFCMFTATTLKGSPLARDAMDQRFVLTTVTRNQGTTNENELLACGLSPDELEDLKLDSVNASRSMPKDLL